jgi:hypothetical protein
MTADIETETYQVLSLEIGLCQRNAAARDQITMRFRPAAIGPRALADGTGRWFSWGGFLGPGRCRLAHLNSKIFPANRSRPHEANGSRATPPAVDFDITLPPCAIFPCSASNEQNRPMAAYMASNA